eukprot:CAMPEP_0168430904 /NCGR_PEP_ID=MMETSP0228-20121227/38112_1 /TAXON_ID=133427 /ORGANISM="Protoceratium reticulatum, Strain CCCM 535 (=CCMP 1889)" /LENGTH=37 /DNA_ID= /DNA_START= /DNA_END= /DNA_ORIENTATION=
MSGAELLIFQADLASACAFHTACSKAAALFSAHATFT